jgi:cobalt-zinc-cadmium efflux system outer membrane protein
MLYALLALASARPALASPPDAAQRAPVSALLRDSTALSGWMSRRSDDVAASRAQLDQARADSRSARLFPNPVLDFSVSNYALGPTNPQGLGLDKTLIFGAGVSELFEIGKRGPRADAADLRLSAAARRSASTLANRVADARLALGRAVYARARYRALDESLQAAKQSAEIARGRLEHQAIAGVDYDRLLLDITSLEADSTRSAAEADSAVSSCSATLLASCDLKGASVADLEVGALSGGAAPNLEQRSDIAALRLESDAARKDATLAGRRAIPDVTVRVGYTHDRFTISGDNENTLSLSAALPIPLFDRGQHDKAKALARAQELEHARRATLYEARGEINGLVIREQALEKTLASIEKDALPRANSVLEAQEKGLVQGQLDMTDMLLARRQAIALRLQALDIRFELFGVRNDLRRALGLDDPAAHSSK